MSEFQKLFRWATPMDVAEAAAMRKLIEMDINKETEFHDDYTIDNSIAGFPATKPSFCIGLSERQ